MAKVSIDNLGTLGIMTDPDPHTLPPEAFTSGGNVRFLDNRVEKFLGHSEVYATPLEAPLWAVPVFTPSVPYWVYAGATSINVYNGTVHTDITRASGPYNGIAGLGWNGGLLGGVLCMNNGVDVPQYWQANSVSARMQDIVNWPSGYSCRSLVPFKQHLIALNLTQNGVEYPHRVLWSHVADPGTLPSSWDITDPTKDAGQHDLSDVNSGAILTGVPLGNQLILYKENSIHSMQPSFNEFIFNFNLMFAEVGILSPRCAVQVPQKRQHFVATGDDLVVHDGQTMTSVLTQRQRRNLLNSLDLDNYSNSFVVVNSAREEIWFCYPSVGQVYPNTSLVFNYETGAIGHRDLPSVSYIATGQIEADASPSWDAATGTWDASIGSWNRAIFNPVARGLLMCSPLDVKLYKAETTNQFDGVNMTSFIERQGLAIIGKDRLGKPRVDLTRRKILSRIWLKLEGGPVVVKALAQEELDGPVTYSPPMPFDPSSGQRYVDLPVPLSGLLLGIRVESSGDVSWKLDGYDLEIQTLGSF